MVGKIKPWVGKSVLLESRMGDSYGRIAYGVRKPMAPAYTPLIECETCSREKTEGQRPSYWFVSENPEHEGLKVRLLAYFAHESRIDAVVRDAGQIFTVKIKRR